VEKEYSSEVLISLSFDSRINASADGQELISSAILPRLRGTRDPRRMTAPMMANAMANE